MTSIALFITHKTKSGKREAVKAIWLKHMAPAVQDNTSHLAYFYTFDNSDPDCICAFQQYESEATAKQFLQLASYQSYLAETKDLLDCEPEIRYLTPRWVK